MSKSRARFPSKASEKQGSGGHPAKSSPPPAPRKRLSTHTDLTPARAAFFVSVVALVIVAAVFLVPAERLTGGYDWFNVWRFQKAYLRSTLLEEGTLPLWCRWSFSGMPFYANPQTGLFYPGLVLYLLAPPATALPFDTLAHFVLAGLGMFLFCRARRLGCWASAFGAIAYLGCGFNLAQTTVGHIHTFTAVAWLPLIFLAVEKWVVTGRLAWLAAGSAAVALQFFGGAIPISWMTIVFAGLYGAGRILLGSSTPAPPGDVETERGLPGWRVGARRAVGLAAIFALGLLMACAQILPTLELTSLSVREGQGWAYTIVDALPPGQLLTLLAPSRLAGRVPWEFYGYFGAATLAFAGAGLAGRVLRRESWLFLSLAILALLMMLGDATPLFGLLYYLVPGLSLFRAHAREVLALTFFLVVLAASAFDAALRGARPGVKGSRDRMGRWVAAGSVALCVLLAAGAQPGAAGATPLGLWVLAVGVSLLGVALLSQARRFSPFVVIAALVLDQLCAERIVRERIFIDTAVPDAQEELANVLRSDEGDHRFWFPRKDFLSNQGYDERRSAIEGYDNNFLKRYQTYIHAMTGAPVKPDVILILTQSNFQYTPGPFPFKALNLKYTAMPKSPNGYTLHTNPDPCGAAFLVDHYEVLPEREILDRMRSDSFDPRKVVFLEEEPPGGPLSKPPAPRETASAAGEVARIESKANLVRMVADSPDEAILVSSEIHYPGWRVRVDGVEQPLLRADYLLRAVRVPRGRHQIEFRFSPSSLHRGLVLSALGWLVGLGLVGASAWWTRRGPVSPGLATEGLR